jgi:hypothetical protein
MANFSPIQADVSADGEKIFLSVQARAYMVLCVIEMN